MNIWQSYEQERGCLTPSHHIAETCRKCMRHPKRKRHRQDSFAVSGLAVWIIFNENCATHPTVGVRFLWNGTGRVSANPQGAVQMLNRWVRTITGRLNLLLQPSGNSRPDCKWNKTQIALNNNCTITGLFTVRGVIRMPTANTLACLFNGLGFIRGSLPVRRVAR